MKHVRKTGRLYSTWVKSARASWVLLACSLGAAAAAPDQPPPTFPTKVELVTVDVVVVDDKGVPFSGLTRDDFVIEEDGRPQPIVSFEAVIAEAPEPQTGPARPAVVATNEVERTRGGRAFALVLDDLSMDLGAAVSVRRAVTEFLQRSVRDGDEVTIATTGGDAWWSARIPEGRDDLLAVAARLRGRSVNERTAPDYMSDYEAFWIDERGDLGAQDVVARVVKRWTDAKVCFERDPGCGPMVTGHARAIETQRKRQSQLTLAMVRRALDALAPVRGRKSLLLFSRGFLEDGSPQAREVAAASREASTAVYFMDARGLTSISGTESAAEAPSAPQPGEFGRIGFEDSTLAAAGASGKRPREWRKLKVQVRREGLKVRARRGYTLQAAVAEAAGGRAETKESGRKLAVPVERALDTAHEVAGIPLRALTYVLEPREKGTHVLIAAEFDASRLTFQDSGKSRAARLEVTAAVTERNTGKTSYSDERVEVRVPEGEAPGWRSVAREFDLPAGVAQARLVVRDAASDAMGAVAQRFEVPPAGTLRLSTPIVSDQVIRPTTRDGKPRAAVAAHRTFAPAGGLYCEFEVFGAARDPADGAPRVSSGLEVRAADGTVVRQGPPTRIASDREGRVVRLVGLDLGGLLEGPYELVLDVRDEVGGGRIERREPFTIAR